jgi:GNAT superfamily N-acetyltransferase
MEFQFREMENKDKAVVFRFLQKHFGYQSVQCREGRFEWQFEKYPLNAKIYLCFDKQELVGQTCFLPVSLRLGNERLAAAFSLDTMVAPEYRRRGLGDEFFRTRLERYQVGLSPGQSEAAARLYEKMGGWLTLGEYFEFKVVKKLPKFQTLKSFVKDSLNYLNYKARMRRYNKKPRIKISRDFPQKMLNELDRGTPHEAFVAVDEDYLDWRYKNHPYFEYRYAHVFDGQKSLGVCVVRESGPENYRVVDFYCPRTNFPALLEGLAYAFNGYSIEGGIVANSLRRYFFETGYAIVRTSQRLIGSSKHDKIFEKLSKYDWLIFGGDADNDR